MKLQLQLKKTSATEILHHTADSFHRLGLAVDISMSANDGETTYCLHIVKYVRLTYINKRLLTDLLTYLSPRIWSGVR